MSNIFEGRTIDWDKFVNFPKCTGSWFDQSNQSGCLLTALWCSMGFSTGAWGHVFEDPKTTVKEGLAYKTAIFCVVSMRNEFDLFLADAGKGLTERVILAYDMGNTSEALDILFTALKKKGLMPGAPLEMEVLGEKCVVEV